MPNLNTHQDTLDLLMEQCDTMRDITSISVNALIAINDATNNEEYKRRITTAALEQIRLRITK